jgi:hypothetical protein
MTKTPKEEKVSSARRRLIKGGIAAPAIVALHSGSALAAASSRNCVVNQLNNPQHPGHTSAPADRYVRVQLWTLRKANDPKIRYFVRGNDIQAVTMGSSQVANRFLLPNEWKEFDPQNPRADFPVSPYSPKTKNNEALSQDGGWVAVRVNATTMGVDIIGTVGPSSTGTAVAGTCWSSFVGIRNV